MSTASLAATATLVILAAVSGDTMAVVVAALVLLAIVDALCDLMGGH